MLEANYLINEPSHSYELQAAWKAVEYVQSDPPCWKL